jgi:hypothetical protein
MYVLDLAKKKKKQYNLLRLSFELAKWRGPQFLKQTLPNA